MTDWISVLLDGIAAVAAIVAVIVAKDTLTQARKEQYDGLRREKEQATLDAYIELQSSMKVFASYGEDEIETFIYTMGKEEYQLISEALARIEIFATGVKREIYDIETVYDLSHGYLDGKMIDGIVAVIKYKQGNALESYHQNTEWLFHAMYEVGKSRLHGSKGGNK